MVKVASQNLHRWGLVPMKNINKFIKIVHSAGLKNEKIWKYISSEEMHSGPENFKKSNKK